MSNVRRFVWIPLAWVAVLSVGLVVAGCGGEKTPLKSESAPKTEATSTAPSTKSKLKGMAEGGDKTARERRAERHKTK